MSYHTTFLFTSRRRHTWWPRDWSSDVCSSDLPGRGVRGRGQRVRGAVVDLGAVQRAHHHRLGGQLVVGDELTRSEEHTSELQSRGHLVCRLLLEKKNNIKSFDY